MPSTDAAGRDVPALLALAGEHEQQGRLDEAQAIVDGILAEAPDEPGAVHQQGILAYRRGRIGEAAALMRRSIALDPGSALLYRNICEVYRALGRLDDASAAGQQAAALAALAPLAALPGIALVSLQKGPAQAEIAIIGGARRC